MNSIAKISLMALVVMLPMVSGLCQSGPGDLLTYRDPKGDMKPVISEQEWNRKRLQIVDSMQVVMGAFPLTSHRAQAVVATTSQEKSAGYTRLSIRLEADTDERVSP